MARPPSVAASRLAVREGGRVSSGIRRVPEETAVALAFNGTAHAVMMATPADLEDFAVGFSLAEGIVAAAGDIRSIDIVEHDLGIELRLWIAEERMAALLDRRRFMAGPTGCGLCGIESLAEAVRSLPTVGEGRAVAPADIVAALEGLSAAQVLGGETRAVHAAGFWRPGEGLVAAREDVGRHNALDKLVGALARRSVPAGEGLVVVTSRLSVEMVQKAAMAGAPVLVAVSAPTALAIRTAEAAGITLVAVARGAEFEVFTHPHRIAGLVSGDGMRESFANVV